MGNQAAVLEGIIKQVVKDLDKERVGIYFKAVIGNFKPCGTGCQL